MKATAYQTKSETVFGNFSKDRRYGSKILANGENLIPTFKSDWYKVDGVLETLEETWIEYKNERYELKNKDLYNEKIPMIIDDSTKEKFQSLIDNNLYEKVYDKIEVKENVPFKTILVDMDVSINLETIKEFKLGDFWSDKKTHYIINLLHYSIVDECLFPRPLLDLTRPCCLKGRNLFIVLSDMIASQKPNNYRINENTENRFSVSNIDKTKKLISWEYYEHKEPNNYFNINCIYANNYDELIKKLRKFSSYVIQKLSENDTINIEIAFEELNQGKDF